jgi:hypothetical protein
VDREAAAWVRSHVDLTTELTIVHKRPWSTAYTAATADGAVWFKACADVQRFEPALTASLHARWPDRTPEVIAHDVDRTWLLLRDAGMPLGVSGNPPEAWLEILPAYGELQRGETAHVAAHLAAGVPDLRVETLPMRFDQLIAGDLPLDDADRDWLRGFAPRLAWMASGLELPPTIQHDDLHMANVFVGAGGMRVLDWGDASVSHPYFSLRSYLPVDQLAAFDGPFARILRRAIDQAQQFATPAR